MTKDKYRSLIGKRSRILGKSQKPKNSGLTKKVLLVTLGIGASIFLTNKAYQKIETPVRMVMEANAIYNPVKDGKLWKAYMKEKELNGFIHIMPSWSAYQKKTKELNGGNLKNIQYTPDANHNGKTN